MRVGKLGASLGALATVLCGCAVGPNYHTPALAAPQAFRAVPTANASQPGKPAPQDATHPTLELTHWWHGLHDAELDSLIERAIQANPDLQIALARLQEARTQEAAALSDVLPTIAGSAASGRGTGSDLTRAGAAPPLRQADNKGSLNQIRQVAGFSASWELDLFGGGRRAIEAAQAQVGGAAAARNDVLISVIADVARNYVDLRGQQERLTIVQANVAAATQSRDLEQTRFDRGLTNELNLRLASRELSTLQAQVPLLVSGIAASENTIATLLGAFPEQLAAELDKPRALPEIPERIEAGLPLDLLRRRPDVQVAERQLAADTALVGVATANLFPHLALNAGVGTQSDTPGFNGSHIWAFGPALYWPLLDFGALDAQVMSEELRAHEQLLSYKKTVIDAVRDADTSIADYNARRERLGALSDALSASARAVDLAEERYDRGLTDYLNVVDAQRQQYSLQGEYTASLQSVAVSFINVCQALGGGWESYQNVPAIRRPQPAVIASFRRLVSHDDPQK